jgi:protease-4
MQLPSPLCLLQYSCWENAMHCRRFWLLAAPIVLAVALPARGDERASATLAHIKLSGSLDEGPVADDPLFGSMGEKFKTKLDRINKAKNDPAVKGLFLQLDGVSAGWGKLDELRRAIADFRKSGKKAYAYLESGDSHDYLAAVGCDRIFMPESGWLMLTGMRAETTFYKDLFDKVGVKADMLQMGAFKAAAEPFTRTSMSKESRQQLEAVLDDYYDHSMVQPIMHGRNGKKWSAEQVKKLIDNGPYTAKAAVAAGLIDRLAYADDVSNTVKTDLDVAQVKVTKNYGRDEGEKLDLTNPLSLLKLLTPRKPAMLGKGTRIAVIYATGMIVSGKGGISFLSSEVCGSTTMIEAIRQAEEDKSVKAIVLRVDSPGGSALASDLIWNALRQCKKPVVASMSDTAASGGYYISMAARKIYAEPGTLTGSIGVVGGKIVIGGLKEKVGLKTEIITRGANANIMSMNTPFNDTEKAAMKAMMQDVYDQFLDKAVEGRKKAGKTMTREALEKLAGGRIWTGRQAKANGLIDELGTLDDAIAAAKDMAGLDKHSKPELLLLPKPRTLLDMILDFKSDARSPLSGVKQLPLFRDLPELSDKLDTLDGLLRLRGEPVWAIMPYRVQVR